MLQNGPPNIRDSFLSGSYSILELAASVTLLFIRGFALGEELDPGSPACAGAGKSGMTGGEISLCLCAFASAHFLLRVLGSVDKRVWDDSQML
jgi:hypothetical protein